NGAVLLRDDFKAPRESIEAALDVLASVPAARRIVVLGEVGEVTGPVETVYQRLGERVGEIASKAIFVTDVNYSAFYDGARRGGLAPAAIVQAPTPSQVIAALATDLGPGAVVLIKGRTPQRLERVALRLAGTTVRCDIPWCPVYTISCADCPMR